ncbi:MAG TPA: helix-turn-helix domain-containing protein [Chitinophagaceae bacterium]|nr:helix-turn-helix domain-containing protein [Chitinophagaceae bacterium]
MFTPDTSNTLFQLAADLINQTNRNIFLTGKAGTGKTTFLKFIRENCPKQMAVVAPTGVAAINAGGVTIHSFFQLPLAPFIPETKRTGFNGSKEETVNRHNLISRMRVNNEKRKLWQQLELLIIDEISMVRCDTLDAVDTILRYFRKNPYEKFGGVQLLFIGDMFQLPPVIKDAEWNFFREHYDSPYFFSSQVIKNEPPLYIEFNKIYRQSEEKFINLLNQVRNNELDEVGLSILDSRFQPTFRRSKNDGYIVLTTHNEQARQINLAALQNLEGSALLFEANITGDFPENAFPAEEMLYLKTGAQVMFIKNDSAERGKRYFNGKIGTVTKLDEDSIAVQCEGDEDEITVEKEEWENIRYSVDKTTQQVKEQKLGSFTQFPLRLAWAITIHKSQGLTFEKAIIDAGEAFAPGQVYVALSRCTSLDGLILKSKIKTGSLFTDNRIIQFSQNIASSIHLQNELAIAKKEYQLTILLNTYNYSGVIQNANYLKEYILENADSFNNDAVVWCDTLFEQLNAIQETATKFHIWLKSQFETNILPEENQQLAERAARALIHFTESLQKLSDFIANTPLVTDSKLHAKECNEYLKEVYTGIQLNNHLLSGYSGKLNTEGWHQRRNSFSLHHFPVNVYAGVSKQKTESPLPALHKELRNLRDTICEQKNLPVYLVLSTKSIDEMARYLPHTLSEIRKISGFGNVKLEQYGQKFLDIVLKYCEANQLESLIHEKNPKKEKATKAESKKKTGGTFNESFRLYKEGKKIAEIAKVRNLAIGTIEGHLSRFIAGGEINIHELVSADKYKLIEAAFQKNEEATLTTIKQQLPPDISFGEIKMVMAALGINRKEN